MSLVGIPFFAFWAPSILHPTASVETVSFNLLLPRPDHFATSDLPAIAPAGSVLLSGSGPGIRIADDYGRYRALSGTSRDSFKAWPYRIKDERGEPTRFFVNRESHRRAVATFAAPTPAQTETTGRTSSFCRPVGQSTVPRASHIAGGARRSPARGSLAHWFGVPPSALYSDRG